MNQKNGKNSLGIDSCFEDLDNPIELFKKWFAKAEKTEINDPNAVAVATSNRENQPNVRMVNRFTLAANFFPFGNQNIGGWDVPMMNLEKKDVK